MARYPSTVLRLDLRIPGDVAHVEHGRVGEAPHLEEAGEAPHVAHHPLCLDLLLEVERRVRGEHVARVGSGDHQRHQAMREGAPEVEVRKLRRHERVQGAEHGSPGQQVRAPAAQLAGAGAGEHEAPPVPRLHEVVHDGEQLGTRCTSSRTTVSQ